MSSSVLNLALKEFLLLINVLNHEQILLLQVHYQLLELFWVYWDYLFIYGWLLLLLILFSNKEFPRISLSFGPLIL